MIRGTRGYAENATELIERYESLPFATKHEAVLHLIPSAPSRALDIGAGTGADAGWLASQGHQVVAVEPTAALREFGRRQHASSRLEWVDDSLPHLERIASRKHAFDLVMLTAVWMHLDKALAETEGLACILNARTESKLAINREAGVTWSRLAFARRPPA